MVNINKIKGRIVENGTSVENMAKYMGVAPSTIYRKLLNSGESFTIKEANDIAKFLDFTPDEATSIFFNFEGA